MRRQTTVQSHVPNSSGETSKVVTEQAEEEYIKSKNGRSKTI